MKMSELGSDISTSEQYQFNYLNLESTMAKLRIGQAGTSSQRVLLDTDSTDLMFPDFWRKTLSNPINGHKDAKNYTKKKLLNEILRPPKLKFPLTSSDGKIGRDSSSLNKCNESMSNPIIQNVPGNSVSAELRLNGITSPTMVTLPDFSSLSIRNSKKGPNLANNKTLRTRPRPWRSTKYKSRFSSLKEYRSLRNALPPIPEVDCIDEDERGSTDSLLTDLCPTTAPPNLQVAHQSCSQQALMETNPCSDDITIDELASYLDVLVHIPKKMSPMAEMMYT